MARAPKVCVLRMLLGIWQVVDNTRADDRLTCKYTGRCAANRSLIDNGGVVELSLTERFASGLTLPDFVAEKEEVTETRALMRTNGLDKGSFIELQGLNPVSF